MVRRGRLRVTRTLQSCFFFLCVKSYAMAASVGDLVDGQLLPIFPKKNKNCQTPVRVRQLVMGYFVGKLRFCSALYFLRGTEKETNTIRFYYAMALSAILGLSAYETVGGGCCK